MGERHWLLEQSLVVGFAAFDFLDFDNLPSQYRPLRGLLATYIFGSVDRVFPLDGLHGANGLFGRHVDQKDDQPLDNERCCFWELVEADYTEGSNSGISSC